MHKILIKDRIAHRLCAASYGLARQAIEIEQKHPWSGQEWGKESAENNRVQEFTAAAIIMSVACVEGSINELFADAGDHLSHAGNIYGSVTSLKVRRAWAKWWRENRGDWRITTIVRAQMALRLADKDELPKDHRSIQELRVLHKLRNALVHSYPEYRPLARTTPKNSLDQLENELTNRFDHCSMVHPKSPFIWKGCLGAGCARWAVQTTTDFENDFYHALGFNRTAVVKL